MPRLALYQIDAFTNRVFGGNPAAVVPLDAWLDDALMQAIAAENNVSETAFFVPAGQAGASVSSKAGGPGGRYAIRWFSPTVEVKLCGHATLAAAHLIFTKLDPGREEVRFETASGELGVTRDGERLVLDFPRWDLRPLERVPSALEEGLGIPPEQAFVTSTNDNLFALFAGESEVRALEPDPRRLAALHPAGVVATARGTRSDCVCRYFAPSYGIPEDPGTGSIHCGLAPFWSAELGKARIHSLQLSKRGAELWCELRGSRTLIAGRAVTYLEGSIDL
jgi:PhzF family phenazine biosynthesis protein